MFIGLIAILALRPHLKIRSSTSAGDTFSDHSWEAKRHATEIGSQDDGVVGEPEPGSGVWWIRYRANGVLKREKFGCKSDALALYQKRKIEIRSFSKKRHRDQPLLISLIFRAAMRNGRATSNPARLVRMRAEANGTVRFLTDVEEKAASCSRERTRTV